MMCSSWIVNFYMWLFILFLCLFYDRKFN
jgi:hypothetical protein